MKSRNYWIAAAFLCSAATAPALDRDFRATGDGKEAPQEVTVYRRANGYTILTKTGGRPAEVTAEQNGKTLFTLTSGGKVTLGNKSAAATLVVKKKEVQGYFLPDTLTGVRESTLLDLRAKYTGANATLPDASNTPLRISGRKGREYNWNHEESTILEQVSNTRLEFTDFEYDVCDASCADLVSGTAEVKEGKLLLTATLREAANCTMRVSLDSIPGAGYSGDGVDFMLDNAQLAKFAGKHLREWKWTDVMRVPFRKDGNKYSWEIPLSVIRPEGAGRVRLRFSARSKKGTDEMPSDGKILPVMRPGNLASDPATKMSVSGCYPMYKTYPLTDGQTSRNIHWCFESWAAEEDSNNVKFVEFRFPKPVPVHQTVIWWEDLPKSAELQYLNAEGKWVTALAFNGADGTAMDWRSAETGAVVLDPAKEKQKKSEKSVLPLPPNTVTSGIRLQAPKSLWIREIEIY